ncbi:MAG: GNAT family N-acetyltransferase [Bullifex sp.]
MIRIDDRDESADLIRSHLREYNRAFFTDSEDINIIDEEDGVFRGGLAACRDFDTLYIDYLAVDPSFRGNGVGRELIHEAERIAASKGARRIRLMTYSFQAPGFYEKMGFRKEFTVSPAFCDYDEYHFVKEVSCADK